jgi:hypothetical protein
VRGGSPLASSHRSHASHRLLIHVNEPTRSRWFTNINGNGPRRHSATISGPSASVRRSLARKARNVVFERHTN